MGETFVGIMGDFNGYALEDSDFNPQSDDSNIDGFFNDDFGDQQEGGEVINRKTLKKGRIKRIRKTGRRKEKQSGTFGGFGF